VSGISPNSKQEPTVNQCYRTLLSNGKMYDNFSKANEVMMFKGKFPARIKITIDSNIEEQVSHFSCLASVITHIRQGFK
jgi:hypothetical protein